MTRLAVALRELDREEEARTLLERALAVQTEALGADHPETIKTKALIGSQ